MKVKLTDRKLLKSFGVVVSGISTALSLILIFVTIPANNDKLRIGLAGAFVAVMAVIYFFMWRQANDKVKTQLKVNRNTVVVKFGDIFQESDCLKVIPANEYFDTIVDDRIIASASLHGQYIERYAKTSPEELRRLIDADIDLKQNISFIDQQRAVGAKTAYKLGTIFKHNDYLLLAFTKFDKNNRAYLDNKLLWESLINMWQSIDTIHSGKSICLPLLGSGLARLVNMNLTEQQLLELLIVSLRLSGVRFNWNVKVTIVVYHGNKESIDLYHLSEYSD